jgi:hypothetical protein
LGDAVFSVFLVGAFFDVAVLAMCVLRVEDRA